jgi:PhoPQ-activated pathogenicity-related protein
MPKLIINAAGDQFFLPDSSRFYFDQLPGEKHLLYEANADHSLKGTGAPGSLTAFYQAIINGTPRPEFQWSLQRDGTFRVITKQAPLTVKLWQAANPEHRDFRVETIGTAYRAIALKPASAGVYTARVPIPRKGFKAYFVELTFASGGSYPFEFTTPVQVVPDVEPYKDRPVSR